MTGERHVRVPTWPTGLPTDPPYDANAFLYPPYRLAWCQNWPAGADGSLAEAMFAIAPTCIRRPVLSEDAQRLLAVSDNYIAARTGRLVFFSDTTATWVRGGADWADFNIDWEQALDNLDSVAPGLHLTVQAPSARSRRVARHQPADLPRHTDPDNAGRRPGRARTRAQLDHVHDHHRLAGLRTARWSL